MERDGKGTYFGIGLDLDALRQGAEESKKILAEISSKAIQEGGIIDKAFGTSGAASAFNVLEAAIRGAGNEIKDMDFGTAEEKIGALSYIIRENETNIAGLTEELNNMRSEAEDAFQNGNTAVVMEKTKAIELQTKRITELTEETEGYRNTLQAVMTASGMSSSGYSVPRLYNSQEDLKHVEDLKNKIAETQAEIQRIGSTGGNTNGLTVSLSALKDELNTCEQAAAEAATALGSDLGNRAVEAQQTLYNCNNAVEAQKEKLNTLSTAVEAARVAFEEIQHSEDATSEDITRAAATYDQLSESLREATEEMSLLQQTQKEATTKWDNINKEIQAHDSILVKMLGGYENYNKMLGSLPAPIQAFVGGIQGMTGAAKMFIATPLGAVIGAIVLALKTVQIWFNSTVEGQLKFAEVSGYVSGILGQLKEIVISTGKAIFNAFTNPKKAVQELWDAIKQNIVNRVQALGAMFANLGQVIKNTFSLDLEEAKANLKAMGEDMLTLMTGVEDLGDKVGNWAAGVQEAATATANITRQNKELDIEISKWGVRKQELEKKKNEARAKMYDTNISAEERKKAQKDFEDALNEEIAAEEAFLDKRIELQKQSMSLTSNTIEDENRLRELQAEKAQLAARKAQEMASLQRRANAIDNSAEKQQNALINLGEMEAEIILKNNKNKLQLMQEGYAKRLEEIKFEHDSELQELNKFKEKLKKLNNDAGIDTDADGLTSEQREQIEQWQNGIDAKYAKNQSSVLETVLSQIRTYEQKRLKVQEEFSRKREELYTKDENGDKVLKKGVEQGNIDEMDRLEAEVLKGIDEEFASRSEAYEEWCGEIANMTLEQLKSTLQLAKEELDNLEKQGEKNTEKLAIARAKVNKAEKAVKKASAENEVNPSKRAIKEWQDLYKTLNECNNSFKEIGQTVGGVAGEIISTAGTIMTSSLSMINGIVQLVNISSAGLQATGKSGASALKTMERASIILTIISSAMQIATQIAKLFNSDKQHQKEIEGLQSRIDQLQWELNNADVVRIQEKNGKALERVRNTYNEINNEVLKTTLSINNSSNAIRAFSATTQVENISLARSAKKLAAAYAEVEYSTNKALGAEKYKEAKREIENIAKQQILLSKQIDEEKKKKKPDDKKITELEKTIEKRGAEAVEKINKIVEDIVGDTAPALAEKLGDAFIGAFRAGEDAAKAWHNTVNNIIADIVKKMLVQQLLEQPLGEIFNKYKHKWFKDGKFQGFNNVNDSLVGLSDELKSLITGFQKGMNGLPEELRNLLLTGAEGAREASKKGIATASQESVDEQNGRLTAIQGHTYSIKEDTHRLTEISSIILESVMGIERNTGRLETIENDIRSVKDSINDISLKGIRIQ